MMGAMFATYTVVNNSYRQVLDKAAISSSSRDMVSMMVRDIRLAGFQYYYGQNEEGIAPFDDLIYTTGLTSEESIHDSHDPIIVIRNELGYVPYDNSTGSQTSSKHEANHVCCDKIHIVYGDFNKNDEQKYKKYRITYFALPMEKMSGSVTVDKYYAIYRSKESWKQPTIDDSGRWITEESEFCPDCYQAELMREYLVDMEFIALDRYGERINTDPAEDHNKLYDIRSVDIKLTFRSSSPKGYFKRKIKNVIKSFDEDRMESITDSFHRESIFVTVHTRNIGEPF